MKFKIKPNNKLWTDLMLLKKKVDISHKKAFDLAKELGFKQIRHKQMVLTGGISSFHSETKPEGYFYTFGSKEPTDVFPKKLKVNKEILAKIDALPVVEYEDLNNILKYNGFETTKFLRTGKCISFAPGILWKKTVILIDVPEHIKYKPVKFMTEITTSEYKKLAK